MNTTLKLQRSGTKIKKPQHYAQIPRILHCVKIDFEENNFENPVRDPWGAKTSANEAP